jgi:hypothetical protein
LQRPMPPRWRDSPAGLDVITNDCEHVMITANEMYSPSSNGWQQLRPWAAVIAWPLRLARMTSARPLPFACRPPTCNNGVTKLPIKYRDSADNNRWTERVKAETKAHRQ